MLIDQKEDVVELCTTDIMVARVIQWRRFAPISVNEANAYMSSNIVPTESETLDSLEPIIPPVAQCNNMINYYVVNIELHYLFTIFIECKKNIYRV